MRDIRGVQIKQEWKISSAAERDKWAEDPDLRPRVPGELFQSGKQLRSSSGADSGADQMSVPPESAGELSKAHATGLQLPLCF